MTLLQRFLLSCSLLACSLAQAQVQVRPEADALRLARHLVGNGVAIQNASFTGGAQSAGFFTSSGAGGIGLDSGLVLTNGKSTSLPGTAIGLASNDLGLPGDALLTALAGKPTSDACVLEFDFVPLGDTLRFRYVFSSEEYPDYVCSEFNDAFAFLLSGPGIPGAVNLALVPGSTIPVTINSINNGTPGNTFNLATCQNMGPGAPFTRLYVNNLQGTSFRHNGRTVVLEAIRAVQACQSYHIKLVIADAGGTVASPDRTFDSGVFLEARSFSAGTLSLFNRNPLDNGQPFLAEGCSSGGFEVRSSIPLPTALTLPLRYGGPAATGLDVSALPGTVTIPAGDSLVFFPLSALTDNLPEGTEMLQVFLGATCPNTWADSLLIEVRDYDTLRITPGSPIVYCSEGTPLALQASAGYSSYQWTPASLFSNPGIANPFVQSSDGVLLQLHATDGSCHHRDSVLLLRKKMNLRGKRDVSCAGRTDGEINIGAGSLWVPPLLFAADNRGWTIDSNIYFLPPGVHTVYLRDATGCTDSLLVTIGQKPDPQLQVTVQDVPCAGVQGQISVAASGGSAPYYWSIDGLAFSNGTVFDRPAGTYQVLLSDFYQCTAQTSVTIGTMPTPQVQLTLTPATCLLDGRLTVSGPPGMEYSLNSAPYQSTVTSFTLPPGPASLRARHHPACVQLFNPVIALQSDLQWSLLHADTLCEGQSKQIVLQSNATAYRWSGPSLSSDTIAMPTATPAQTSLYHVTATRGNCSHRDSMELFVRRAPIADAGADTALCQGDRGTLRGSGGLRFNWMPASGVSDPALANPQVRPQVTSTYWTTVTDRFGCKSLAADTVQIRVVPTVRAFAGRDTVVAMGQPLQLEGIDRANSGVTQYNWSPNLWLSSDTIARPLALPGTDINYLLTLRTPEGCSGTSLVKVKLYRDADIYVPTAFTPNGDGKNDRLRAIPIGMRSFQYFRVFNRWGALVFETRDPALGWDGLLRGQQQDSNVYIWVAEGVDYRGNAVLRKGSVLLLH